MNIKQLIKKQRNEFEKKFTAFENVYADKEELTSWHTQSLISLIQSEIERKEGMMKLPYQIFAITDDPRTALDDFEHVTGYNTAIAEDIKYWQQALLDLEK